MSEDKDIYVRISEAVPIHSHLWELRVVVTHIGKDLSADDVRAAMDVEYKLVPL